MPASDTGAAVLHLHGGGMIAGSVPIFDGPLLSLQYRLAPEHPHPVPVEDAYARLTWLAGHAGQLSIDPGGIAVMGDSAGGGLAAGVAILSRDRQGPAIAHQLLIYPMLDDRTTTPDPYIAPFAGWSYDDNATGWNALLGAGHEKRDVDPAAAPGHLKDARGLPPAYIEVGQLDVFRDASATGWRLWAGRSRSAARRAKGRCLASSFPCGATDADPHGPYCWRESLYSWWQVVGLEAGREDTCPSGRTGRTTDTTCPISSSVSCSSPPSRDRPAAAAALTYRLLVLRSTPACGPPPARSSPRARPAAPLGPRSLIPPGTPSRRPPVARLAKIKPG